MYARNYSETENKQSFNRGEYTIPADYRGNAFTADEVPNADDSYDIPCMETVPMCERCKNAAPEDTCQKEKNITSCPTQTTECTSDEGEERKGLFGKILSRFDRGFELDDLLIIGLILILLNGDKSKCPEKRDEIVILLALLLLGG